MIDTRGFIALMSAIIISAVLLVVIIGGSLIGFYSRFNILDADSKERSRTLADACVGVLLYRLAMGETVTNPVAVGTESCEILTAANPYQLQAQINGAHTNLEVVVDSDYHITTWKEVGEF